MLGMLEAFASSSPGPAKEAGAIVSIMVFLHAGPTPHAPAALLIIIASKITIYQLY
jgi:hypothetical protein